jgi:hypothetical protein
MFKNGKKHGFGKFKKIKDSEVNVRSKLNLNESSSFEYIEIIGDFKND